MLSTMWCPKEWWNTVPQRVSHLWIIFFELGRVVDMFLTVSLASSRSSTLAEIQYRRKKAIDL